MVFVVANTCFKSTTVVVLAAMVAALNRSIPSRRMLKVCDEADVLHTTMLVITAVVDAGTVYRVPFEVANAVLANAFAVFGIMLLF